VWQAPFYVMAMPRAAGMKIVLIGGVVAEPF
jgi:hypothetical protein